MFDSTVFVYRFSTDVHFYIAGSQGENELILVSVLSALYDTVSNILRNQVDKRSMLENMESVFLTVDEIIDGGIVLETDAAVITSRVSMKGAEEGVPLSEQTLSQVLATAKEHMARNLLK